MPTFQDTETDNPSIPPPGKRTGRGVRSIFPFLVRSLATKPQVQPHPDDLTTIPQFSPSDEPKPRKRP